MVIKSYQHGRLDANTYLRYALIQEGGNMSGAELRQLRERHGWTQQELAELLGYTIGHIGHLEQENRRISKRLEKQLLVIDRLYPEKKVNLGSRHYQ